MSKKLRRDGVCLPFVDALRRFFTTDRTSFTTLLVLGPGGSGKTHVIKHIIRPLMHAMAFDLMVMASAVALPLQQLVLCSPLMFQYKESFFWGDGVALALVLSGFGEGRLAQISFLRTRSLFID